MTNRFNPMTQLNHTCWSRLFWFPSILYGCGMRIRNALYRLGLIKIHNLNAFVISVGNITIGGTGKTPLVIYLAQWLAKQQLTVAVLSRGYKRKSKNALMVSDGKGRLASALTGGDEPFLIARRAKQAAVYVGSNRVKTARMYTQKSCDIIILDDGFQHLRISRDINIVCMNANNPWGNSRTIPAGWLREPLSGLNRADFIVRMHSGKISAEKNQIKNIQKWTSAPVIEARRTPKDWIQLGTDKPLPLNHLHNKKVLAFAGIANPDSFKETLAAINIEPDCFLPFMDHHWYSEKDLGKIINTAEQQQSDVIITTEKDAVRVPAGFFGSVPIYFLRIEIQIENADILLKSISSKNRRRLNKGS